MKRMVPALAWAWIALVISICADFAFLAADVGQRRPAPRRSAPRAGAAGSRGRRRTVALDCASPSFSAFSSTSSATSRSTPATSRPCRRTRDVLEGEHRALHVLGERRLLRLEVAEEALAHLGRDVVHQPGDQVGRAALGEVALQHREEVALDRALDRGRDRRVERAAPATGAARPSGRSRAPAARARSPRPRRAARSGPPPRSAGARPAGSSPASAPACRSAAPRPSGPRSAGGRRSAAAPRPRRRGPRRAACAPPWSRRQISGPVVRSSRNSTITASSTSWLILPRPLIARAKRSMSGSARSRRKPAACSGPMAVRIIAAFSIGVGICSARSAGSRGFSGLRRAGTRRCLGHGA